MKWLAFVLFLALALSFHVTDAWVFPPLSPRPSISHAEAQAEDRGISASIISDQSLYSDLPNKAYEHLREVMDKYHQSFDVYTDVAAGGTHFVRLARTGIDAAIDSSITTTVHSGITAIKNTFSPSRPDSWGGW